MAARASSPSPAASVGQDEISRRPAKSFSYVALAHHDNTIGATEIAKGSAREVAKAIATFGGWIGTVVNVERHVEGQEPLMVDQICIDAHRNYRTGLGWECRQNIAIPDLVEWLTATFDEHVFRSRK